MEWSKWVFFPQINPLDGWAIRPQSMASIRTMWNQHMNGSIIERVINESSEFFSKSKTWSKAVFQNSCNLQPFYDAIVHEMSSNIIPLIHSMLQQALMQLTSGNQTCPWIYCAFQMYDPFIVCRKSMVYLRNYHSYLHTQQVNRSTSCLLDIAWLNYPWEWNLHRRRIRWS